MYNLEQSKCSFLSISIHQTLTICLNFNWKPDKSSLVYLTHSLSSSISQYRHWRWWCNKRPWYVLNVCFILLMYYIYHYMTLFQPTVTNPKVLAISIHFCFGQSKVSIFLTSYYDERKTLALVLTKYNQLWYLTSVQVAAHFDFMQMKHFLATKDLSWLVIILRSGKTPTGGKYLRHLIVTLTSVF